MTMLRRLIFIGAVAAMLGGCSTINKITGETDNTVLPGQREDAIPGRAQFPESDTASTAPAPESGQQEAAGTPQSTCQPDDPACKPASGDETFSDPQ